MIDTLLKKYLNFNTIFLVILGLALIAYGGWYLYRYRGYQYGGGILLIGVGNVMFGITNGFADPTPPGRLFFKIGVMSYVVGILAVAYTMRYILR